MVVSESLKVSLVEGEILLILCIFHFLHFQKIKLLSFGNRKTRLKLTQSQNSIAGVAGRLPTVNCTSEDDLVECQKLEELIVCEICSLQGSSGCKSKENPNFFSGGL